MAEANKTGKASVAKHQQISDFLLSEIEAGRWGPGEKLPSEEQLASELSFSLGTVQRALRSLRELGVVERRQGAGTFVLGARALERHLRHFRFTAKGGSDLLPVYFQILEVTLTQESGPWVDFLNEDSGSYVNIKRIVSVNEEFELYSELYLPASRFHELTELGPKWLDGLSIRDVLAKRFNAPTLDTSQSMACEVLPPRVCRAIQQPPGQYGMIWTIAGTSFRNIPITWQRVFVPPSDRELEISMTRAMASVT